MLLAIIILHNSLEILILFSELFLAPSQSNALKKFRLYSNIMEHSIQSCNAGADLGVVRLVRTNPLFPRPKKQIIII